MSKNSRSFNNVPFAPVCAALTTSTEKESSAMINRCSALNFGRSKHLRTDQTGALSQECIAYRRSSTGTARSNSSRDMNVYRSFVLYLRSPVYLQALRWTNSRLRIPTKYLQTRSSDMWRWVSGVPRNFVQGGGGEVFNKFSWGQRTERTGIWGR